MKNKIIFILGPTSSGKSLLAVKLAKYINGEIISADSIQIYKKINILSGKINLQEQENIIHHMIDIVEPYEEFSVFKYIKMIKHVLNNIFQKNKIAIITGGTGLYTKVLINNKIMPVNIEFKKRITNIHEIYGNKFLFNWLKIIDKENAKKIGHFNDTKRIIRSLEIYYNNIHNTNNIIQENIFSDIKILKLILMPIDRKNLYDKINSRVDNMLKHGLLNEVNYLFSKYTLSKTAKQAIGYKELISYLEKKSDIDLCIENIKQKSRNYAKRQITWLKNQEHSNFIYYEADEDIQSVFNKMILLLNK